MGGGFVILSEVEESYMSYSFSFIISNTPETSVEASQRSCEESCPIVEVFCNLSQATYYSYF